MGRRTLLLIASVLVAAVGTALIGLYVRGADDRARGQATAVEVLVATQDIPVGATPGAGSFREEARRSGDLPDGYLTDRAQIKGRVVTPILKGQTLQDQMFGASGGGAPTLLADGHWAVSVTLNDPERTASLLTPGSQVVIYVTRHDGGKATELFDQEQITVVGVGDETTVSDTNPVSRAGRPGNLSQNLPRTNVTLELTPEQIPKLLQNRDDLYFAWTGPAATATSSGSSTGG
jgi:pilus assembly protein CpaB